MNARGAAEANDGRVGAADAAKHKIYVWDLSQEGVLHETLEGGREPLVDVQVSTPMLLPPSLLTYHILPYCSGTPTNPL